MRDEFLVPEGLVCASCNQYFGAKVEEPALRTFPFDVFRFAYGLETKKGRPVRVVTPALILEPGERPGFFRARGTAPEFHEKLMRGDISQFLLPASISEPEVVCRLLLKIGLELIGARGGADVRAPLFDPARTTARAPRQGSRWWFYMNLNSERLSSRLEPDPAKGGWSAAVGASVFRDEEEGKWAMIAMFSEDIYFLCPLEPDAVPEDPPTVRSSPGTSLHRVTF